MQKYMRCEDCDEPTAINSLEPCEDCDELLCTTCQYTHDCSSDDWDESDDDDWNLDDWDLPKSLDAQQQKLEEWNAVVAASWQKSDANKG